MTPDKEAPEEKEDAHLKRAKTFADAVSTQAQVANRSWFAMMTVALFAVLPRQVGPSNAFNLPFGLGAVPVASFYLFVYPLMVILIIAFSSAHAQQITAQNEAQDFLNRLKREGQIKPRTWFDMWRKPSLNRVGPLPISLYNVFPLNKNQMLSKIIVRLYYAVLKVVALGIYFIFPLYALWNVYIVRLGPVGTVTRKLFLFGAVLATWTIVQILILEARYAWRAGKKL